METVEQAAGPESVDDAGPVGEAETSDALEPEAGAPGAPTDGSDAEGSEEPDDGPQDGKDPLRFNSWMKRTATGAVMTGIAVGLQQALELPRQEPAFVIEASGEPEDPNRPIDLRFDPDSPADTVAIIRRPPVADAPEEPSPPS